MTLPHLLRAKLALIDASEVCAMSETAIDYTERLYVLGREHENARLQPLFEQLIAALEASQELRIYCLGSDASTQKMIAKYDSALAALSALVEK